MLLAVDIGNSAAKFGIFEDSFLVSTFSIQSQRNAGIAELTNAIAGRIDRSISAAVVSSVVPELDPLLRAYLQLEHNVDPVFVDNTFDFGLKINYEPAASAGADRLIAAFAAVKTYGPPVIVCDFGTATTIDAVNSAREYLGGIITPGMKTMAEALHHKTSKLPSVEIAKPISVIGSSTIGSIQSGIFWGYVALVEGLISRMIIELREEPRVIATGGYGQLIANETAMIDEVDETLILTGLANLGKSST